MQEKIGNVAGDVWNLLREKKEMEVSRLPRMLNEKTLMIYQALGWLARENKLQYRKKGDKIYVSLAEHERGK